MSVARQLNQLQQVDLELESNEKAQSYIVGQLGDSQEVARIRSQIDAENQRLEELQKQQHSLEWEIDDLSAKLTAIEQKLYGGKITSPKELANLQREAEEFKDRRNRLEDKDLEIMDKMESATTTASSLGADLKKLESEWQSRQKQLSADLEKLKTAHSDLTNKRQLLSAEIEPRVITVYHQLRKQKGTAIARVEQGTCRGCQIALPTTELQQARSGSLVYCSSCGRILFLA
jgi:predicted  nucleic acid-binding Zn-ribbon protein